MDELSEEDKLTVARARKIQRFLSQPFQVAEVFTGHPGKLVPLEETIKVSPAVNSFTAANTFDKLDAIQRGRESVWDVFKIDKRNTWRFEFVACKFH